MTCYMCDRVLIATDDHDCEVCEECRAEHDAENRLRGDYSERPAMLASNRARAPMRRLSARAWNARLDARRNRS